MPNQQHREVRISVMGPRVGQAVHGFGIVGSIEASTEPYNPAESTESSSSSSGSGRVRVLANIDVPTEPEAFRLISVESVFHRAIQILNGPWNNWAWVCNPTPSDNEC